MGAGPSQLHFPPAAVAAREELAPLARTATADVVRQLAARMRDEGVSGYVSVLQLRRALGVADNAFFGPVADRLFALLRQREDSAKVSGLELVAALALLSEAVASPSAKAAAVFGAFDLDGTGVLDESALRLLFRACAQGLAKCTRGMAVALDGVAVDVDGLADDCLRHAAALGLASRDGSVTLRAFSAWAAAVPAVAAVVGAFTVGSRLHVTALRKRQCRACGRALPAVQREALAAHPWRDLEHPAVRRAPERVAVLRLQCFVRAWLAGRRFAARRAEVAAAQRARETAAALLVQRTFRQLRVARRLRRIAHVEGRKYRGAVVTMGAGPALGTGAAGPAARPEVVPRFKLDCVDIRALSSAPAHAAALSTDGRLFCWGQSFAVAPADAAFEAVEPAPAAGLPAAAHIVQVACGNQHTVALTDGGDVLAWGAFDHGQLGLGDEDQARQAGVGVQTLVQTHSAQTALHVPAPTEVRYFSRGEPRLPVRQLACGYYYTLALTDEGHVYAWGENTEGQLGLGAAAAGAQAADARVAYADEYLSRSTYAYHPTPRRVDALAHIPVAQVATGGNHSMALGENHVVFQWGAWGRRLPGDCEPALAPQLMRNADRLALSALAVGDEHALGEGASLWLRVGGRDLYVMVAAFGPTLRNVRDDRTGAFEVCELRLFEENEDRMPELGDPDEDELERLRFARPDVAALLALDDSSDDDDEPPERQRQRRWAARAQGFHARPSLVDPQRASPLLREHMLGTRPRPLFKEVMEQQFSSMSDKIVVLDRPKPPGLYLRITGGPGHGLELPVLAAKFSPTLSRRGVESRLYYSEEVSRKNSLLYNVRENEVPGSVCVLELCDADVELDATADGDAMVDQLMRAMARRVYQAQRAGALAVVLVFDFQGAEPFAVEDREGLGLFIPAVMVDRAAGRRVMASVPTEARVTARLFAREDGLRAQVEAAQAAGAAGFLVQQPQAVNGGRAEALVNQQLADYARNLMGGNVPDRITTDTRVGITTVCGMLSHTDGAFVHAELVDVARRRAPPLTARLVVRDTGNTYAWGYAGDGRLGHQRGLEVGFSEAQGDEYLCASRPELITAIAGVHARALSAGSEHSALVSQHGEVYTWGAGDDGRLGHLGEDVEVEPRVVDALRDFEAVDVVASDTHTVVLLALASEREVEERRKQRKARLADGRGR